MNSKELCNHLGGKMSMSAITEFGYTIGSPDKCIHSGTQTYWIPVVQGEPTIGQNGHNQWLDDRPGHDKTEVRSPKWRNSEPNGHVSEQCVDIMQLSEEYFWNDDACSASRCSICLTPAVQSYRLRGTSLYDQLYTLSLEMQKSSTRISFEGEDSSWLYWYPQNEKTVLLDSRYRFNLTMNQHPFGILQPQVSTKKMLQGQVTESSNRWIFTNVSN